MKKIIFEFKHNKKYKIKGVNLEKCFNNLIKNKIKLKNIIKNEDNTAEFYINYKNDKVLKQNLNKFNITILEEKDFGVQYFFRNLFFRVGLISACIISLIFLFISQMFVFKIEIYGNDKLSKTEIISELEKLGINSFTPKSSLNLSKLESELLENMPEISLVSIITKGNSLILNLQEKVINDEYQNVGNFEALKATASGRIKSINLKQGTLKVKVGDIVKEGDILVEPYIIDSSGEKRSVKAEAEILAEIWFEARITHYDSSMKTIKTGNKIVKDNIYFLNLPVYVDKKEVTFTEYEVSKNIINLSNFLIPIKIERLTYEETTTIKEEIPFEDVKEELILEAKNLALEKAKNNSVVDEYHTVTSNAGVTSISYVIVAEGDISLQ